VKNRVQSCAFQVHNLRRYVEGVMAAREEAWKTEEALTRNEGNAREGCGDGGDGGDSAGAGWGWVLNANL
jgi:hypothetical protein